MRKGFLFSAAFAVVLLSAAFTGGSTGIIVPAHTDEYVIDTSLSRLEWTGKKATGKHYGSVKILRGSIFSNHGMMTGDFQIDMKSIKNLDLDAKMGEKLVGHLKSPDFFSVDSFPIASFDARKFAAYNGPDDFTHTVTGNLTIKGITHEIVFPAKMSIGADKITAEAYFEIDRSKWNVRYGSKSFFNDIGDKAISDNIGFKVNLVATHAHH
jgi:polyisoprenoid-binding protein YceI